MNGYTLKVLIPIHFLTLISMALLWLGMASLEWLWLSLFSWFLFGCLGVEIGFHRLLSHQAFSSHPLTSKVLSVLGCFGGQWAPLQWAALHMGYHHKHTDQNKDYHSPEKGWWSSYMGWYFKIGVGAVNLGSVRHLLRDSFQRFLFVHYVKIIWVPIGLVSIINYKIGLYGFVLPMFLVMNQTNLSNVFGHIPRMGYRNHETKDRSTNVIWLAPFSWGLAIHNNHHADPSKWNFSEKFWEIDISSWVIPLLSQKSQSKVADTKSSC